MATTFTDAELATLASIRQNAQQGMESIRWGHKRVAKRLPVGNDALLRNAS